MDNVTFTKKIEVKAQIIEDTLVSAFEGGSNYWYSNLEPLKETSTKRSASERFYDNMLTHGFRLEDNETGKKHVVKPTKFKTALELMTEKYARHFNDMQSENGDGETGDVFLQLLVHGDVIYG